MKRLVTLAVTMSAVFLAVAAPSAGAQTARDLEGTWTLVSAVA